MTEHDWRTCTDPRQLLYHLTATVNDKGEDKARIATKRKLYLFSCACHRSFHKNQPHQAYLGWEQADAADGTIGDAVSLAGAWSHPSGRKREGAEEFTDEAICRLILEIFGNPWRYGWIPSDWRTETVLGIAAEAELERDPETGRIDPERLAILADALEDAGASTQSECWRCKGTGSHGVVYEITRDQLFKDNWDLTDLVRYPPHKAGKKAEGKPAPCPVCNGAGKITSEFLAHLRGPGPHYRGCWALDLAQGKS